MPRDRAVAPTLKVRNTGPLLATLRELGGDPEDVLSNAGIPPALFADPENLVPFGAVGRIVARCIAATGMDNFAFLVGMQSAAAGLGLTGLVSLNSPTVRDGIEVIKATLKTSDTGGEVFLAVRDRVASAGYSVVVPDIECADQIEDAGLAIFFNILRQLCGPSWLPLRVRLTRSAPRNAALHHRFYAAPIEFSGSTSCIEFEASMLDVRIANSNPDYLNVLRPLLREAIAVVTPDFLASARSVVRAQVATGTLSRENVCRELGLSARSLASRLEALGVSYSSLADAARYDAARGLLMKNRPISEIASTLGFADQSAFTRAFKSWAGVAPGRWRSARAAGKCSAVG